MKKPVLMMAALGLLLALSLPPASAQAQATGTQPAAQDPAKEEADAYKAWYDAYTAKDTAKAVELGKAFVAKFPSSKYADFIKKYLAGARGQLFGQAMQAKNNAEMIRLANEALAEDPDNLDYLYLLALSLRTNELFASPPNFAHASDATSASQRAIRLIEAGKVPTVVDKAKWDQKATLSWLYQNLAVIEANAKNSDKALEHYMKASSLDPKNAFNFLACGSIHQAKYQAAAQKYQTFPDADRDAAEPKPEVKAALDEVNKEADAVIDCWARFMALTAEKNDFGPTRGQVEKALTELYKYRHPDSADGLQKLIDHYRSGATTPPPAEPVRTSNSGAAPASNLSTVSANPGPAPASNMNNGAMKTSSAPATGAPGSAAKKDTATAKPAKAKPRAGRKRH